MVELLSGLLMTVMTIVSQIDFIACTQKVSIHVHKHGSQFKQFSCLLDVPGCIVSAREELWLNCCFGCLLNSIGILNIVCSLDFPESQVDRFSAQIIVRTLQADEAHSLRFRRAHSSHVFLSGLCSRLTETNTHMFNPFRVISRTNGRPT